MRIILFFIILFLGICLITSCYRDNYVSSGIPNQEKIIDSFSQEDIEWNFKIVQEDKYLNYDINVLENNTIEIIVIAKNISNIPTNYKFKILFVN